MYQINSDFESVISNCAKNRKKDKGSWINNCIKNTYINMHKLGHAHSIECWDENKLIGGLYGIHINGCFFGESMFSKTTNASKHCLLFLISILIKYDYQLLDSQFYNPHLVQFGAYEILDEEYQNKLKNALEKKSIFPNKITYLESKSILQSLTQTS